MTPRYWIEFRDAWKIALFAVVVAALIVFWYAAPAEAWSPRRRFRVDMLFLWGGGWFALLFVRVEDLHVRMPFDYQMLVRLCSLTAIVMALALAGQIVLRWMDYAQAAAMAHADVPSWLSLHLAPCSLGTT